jgi:hypothetical protein
MSHISSSRMPHAYAAPEPETGETIAETVTRDAVSVRESLGTVSRGAWALGALGVGAVGAALYATFRPKAPAPKKRRAAKPAQRRTKAAA